MKRALALGLGVVVACLGWTAPTRGQDEANKLVGVWEVTKSDELPPGSSIEFTKDGKVSVVVKEKGDTIKLSGSYAVEKAKLTVKLKFGDQTIDETVTIKKLTATELHIEDKDKKVDEFKKK